MFTRESVDPYRTLSPWLDFSAAGGTHKPSPNRVHGVIFYCAFIVPLLIAYTPVVSSARTLCQTNIIPQGRLASLSRKFMTTLPTARARDFFLISWMLTRGEGTFLIHGT